MTAPSDGLDAVVPRLTADPVVAAVQAMARGGDLVDALDRIAEYVAEIDGVSAGAVLLWADHRLHLVGGSDHETATFDVIEQLSLEGPGVESCRTGRVTFGMVPNPAGAANEFRAAGVPMAFRGEVLGAIVAIGEENPSDNALASIRVLADTAAVVVVSGDPAPDDLARLRTLRSAIDERVLIEQACGMLAERHRISPAAARYRIRAASVHLERGVVEIARRVVDRDVDEVLQEHLAMGVTAPD